MRVMVTRPREDGEALATILAARGIESLIEPLLEIELQTDVSLPLEDVQAVLITSANGVRALAQATARRDLSVLAVGSASAAAARDAGFTSVCSADGDVNDLARLVESCYRPGDGALLHVAGSATAGDLGGALTAAGFVVRRSVLYMALAADALSPTATAALTGGTLDGVLVYSPRTAAILARLLQDGGLAPSCARLRAFCMSDAVADALRVLPFGSIDVARRPDQDALLALIDREKDLENSDG